MQELPEQAGIQLANWYWKGVRQFVWERFGTSLSRSWPRLNGSGDGGGAGAGPTHHRPVGVGLRRGEGLRP